MRAPFDLIYLLATGVWAGALAYLTIAVPILGKRLGRRPAWQATRALLALADLLGTWVGTIAVGCLWLGRHHGFRTPWAVCLGTIALMIALALYHRAVLIPSLDAAFKRLGAGDEDPKWGRDWHFLWRMSQGLRYSILLGSILCFVLGVEDL